MSDNERMVTLLSSDNRRFEINMSIVISHSKLLSSMLEDVDDDETPTIPLSVTSFLLENVVEYMKNPNLKKEMSDDELISYIIVSNYMNIETMLDELTTREANKINKESILSTKTRHGYDKNYYKEFEPEWNTPKNIERLENEFIFTVKDTESDDDE